jgi:integrase
MDCIPRAPNQRIKAPEKSAGQRVLISFAGNGIIKQAQRSGFHNLRHSLSSFLIAGQKSDVRTTQVILRHSSSAATLDLYIQSPMAQSIAAQVLVLSRCWYLAQF